MMASKDGIQVEDNAIALSRQACAMGRGLCSASAAGELHPSQILQRQQHRIETPLRRRLVQRALQPAGRWPQMEKFGWPSGQ